MQTPKILLGLAAIALAASAHATTFSEGFDSVGTLTASGWVLTNASTTPANAWFQGNEGVFASQTGAAASYIGANYLSSNTGSISNWLISPVLTVDAGSFLSFYTKSAATAGYGDVLEVLFSSGTGTTLSDFVVLGTIGSAGVTGYPDAWTQYSFSLPTATGRFAFRYAGTVDTADYIGIDTVSVSTVAAAIPEPSTYALMALGIAGLALVRRRTR